MSKRKHAAVSARHSLESGNPATDASISRNRESSDFASYNVIEWQSREFVRTLSEEKLPRREKLQARAYAVTGKFPVIDQGQSEIAGWTNDESLVIDDGFPYIVFGDHTRSFKYVDKPFVLGADGTQLLKPSHEYCPRFFYYACLQLDLPSRGYNRHFTFLKEKSLPLPPKPEQERIAATLWTVQRAISTQDGLIAATADLKASVMQRLFTHGLRGEALKDTEIGLMPESWALTTIDDIGTIGAGGTPSRGSPEFWNGGTIPWVKTGEVDYGIILDSEEKITPLGLHNSAAKLLPKGTLLVAMYGQGVTRGKVAILGIDAATNQACASIRVDKSKVCVEFMLHVLAHGYERLRGLAHGGQQQNLNADLIRGFAFGYPVDAGEQRAIADALATLDRKLAHHRAKRASLHSLFQTLLHQLMTAQIRVDGLKIDTSDIRAPAVQGEQA